MASQYSQDKTGFPREACLALCCLAPARLQPHRALLCLRLSACSLHRSGLEPQDPLCIPHPATRTFAHILYIRTFPASFSTYLTSVQPSDLTIGIKSLRRTFLASLTRTNPYHTLSLVVLVMVAILVIRNNFNLMSVFPIML